VEQIKTAKSSRNYFLIDYDLCGIFVLTFYLKIEDTRTVVLLGRTVDATWKVKTFCYSLFLTFGRLMKFRVITFASHFEIILTNWQLHTNVWVAVLVKC